MNEKNYEFNPDYAASPGELLIEALEQRKVRQSDFAKTLGYSRGEFSRLLNDESTWSDQFVIRLENELGIPASFWKNARKNYQRIVKKKRGIEEIAAIALNLKRFRAERNYSQKELAEKSDVPLSRIRALENCRLANRDSKTLCALAKALNVTLADIVVPPLIPKSFRLE